MIIETINTDEVSAIISYGEEENSLLVQATGDLQHHVIEEVIFKLADMFNLNDHLDIIANKIKARYDLTKEI